MYLPEYSIGSDERPAAYIILLRDERISKGCGYDIGAASTMVMRSQWLRSISLP